MASTTSLRSASSRRNTDFARAAVRLEFRGRDAKAIDQGEFIDCLPDQAVRRHIETNLGGEEHVVSQVGGKAMTTDTQIVTAPDHHPSITAKELVNIAEQINAEHEAAKGAFGSAFEHAARAGLLLRRAKLSVPHGEWLPWIRNNCPMSRRTVQMYMRIALELPTLVSTHADTKNATVAHLTLTEADRLLAKPKGTSSSTPKVVEPTEVLPPPEQARHNPTNVRARQRKREREAARYEREEAEGETHEKRVQETLQEACDILLKLDTSDLDRLLELLNPDTEWGWMRLPKALAHAMRYAEA